MGLSKSKNNPLQAKHLEGNLVIVQGHQTGTSPSTIKGAKPGDTFDWIRSTTVVLDGPVSTELAEAAGTDQLPIVLEDFRWAELAIVGSVDRPSDLRRRVGKYDDDGTPRLVVGVIGEYTNSFRNTSYRLEEPDDAQFELAGNYVNSTAGADVFPEKDPFEDGSRASAAFA